VTIRQYSTRANQERRENPNRLRTWRTASGGVVTQFWGMRIYCGRCRDCNAPVTTRRDVSAHNWGMTRLGRWPELCGECRAAKGADRKRRQVESVRELRRKQSEKERVQRENLGLPPARPGRPRKTGPTPKPLDW
jgi:hypothetical protein